MAKGKKKQDGKKPQKDQNIQQVMSELTVTDASASTSQGTSTTSQETTPAPQSHEATVAPQSHEATPVPSVSQTEKTNDGNEKSDQEPVKKIRIRPPRKKKGGSSEKSQDEKTAAIPQTEPIPGQQMPQHGHPMPIPGQQMPHHGHTMPSPGQQMPHHGRPMPISGQQIPQLPQQAPVQQLQPPRKPAQEVRSSGMELQKYPYEVPPRYDSKRLPSRPLKLLTNYLLMKINPNTKVYRYDASFKPDRPKKAIPEAFKVAMQKHFSGMMVAFDQVKNFYSVERLPNVTETSKFETSVEILDQNKRVMKFEITFKATGMLEFKNLLKYMQEGGTSLNPPTEVIQCVDVVLRQGTLQKYVKAGRQFFKRPANPISLGDGLEMWTGLFQSAIFTSRPYINIDVAHKGFPIQQPLLSLVQSFNLDVNRPITSQRGYGVELFTQYIKMLRVVARVGGTAVAREFICNGLVKPPREISFKMTTPEGAQRQMTVLDYFTKEKGCRLKCPDQNCMWVGPRDKNIFYPMELLEVSYGQVRNRQLNDNQLRTMVREAATPPDQRRAKIQEVIKDMQYSSNPYFKKFGLEIRDQFTPVPGKLLDAPKLTCGLQRPIQPSRGVWNADRLLTGARLLRWAVVCVECDPKNTGADQLERMFQNEGRRMGIEVEKLMFPVSGIQRADQLQRYMEDAAGRGAQLMLVVVSTRNKELYSKVKRVAELHVGMLTQCLKDQTCQRKLNGATVKNILLKVNSKLMGVNQAIAGESLPQCMRRPLMVVGADVTHPSPDQTNIPSIAAVTASIDQSCYQYNTEISIQAPKEEIIRDFEEMMVRHLNVFRAKLRVLPQQIYVFRDGVSEGQFGQVLQTELPAVYKAAARVSGGGPAPQVVFLLVQKRHHTRFFIDNSNRNVEPGTVVDTEIVHPRELDFYLVSHAAIKGTARPTRYHCIRNDPKADADDIEQLAFYLCHLFSRCTRAVSLPAPTYYAHLACARAKALTLGDTFDFKELEKKPRRLNINNNLHQNNPMFFV